MKIIGLTGGIGMGKSTAASAFRRAGVPVFDADAAVHSLQRRNGRAIPAIARAFPGTVKDGVLDRAMLRAIVLSDRAALRRLEGILHPLVKREQKRFLGRNRASRFVVLDIPLLFEGGGDRRCDLTVVVSAPASVQRARVRARRRMSDADIDRMIALQMPDAEKRARADVVIRTGLSRSFAARTIRRLMARLRDEK